MSFEISKIRVGGPSVKGPEVFLLRLQFPLMEEALGLFASECSPARRVQASHYRFPEDRARCLAAGWLVRQTLLKSRRLAEPEPDRLHEIKDAMGRPYLEMLPEKSISIAHSGEWVVCALHHTAVGVDVEREKAAIEFDSSAEFMSTFELERYRNLKDLQPLYFIRIWTMKEAYLKALGKGFSEDPTTVTVDGLLSSATPDSPVSCGSWFGSNQSLPGAFRLAVCWRNSQAEAWTPEGIRS